MQALNFKHILAAIDFSPWPGPVLRSAADLADRYGSTLSAR